MTRKKNKPLSPVRAAARARFSVINGKYNPVGGRSQDNFLRVSRRRPCPVCGKADWCGISRDGDVAICMRIADGAFKPTRNGGWLHFLRPLSERPRRRNRRRFIRLQEPAPDFGRMASKFASVGALTLRPLADELGVSLRSLARLRAGWSEKHQAWAFPMSSADEKCRGIRLRGLHGGKWAVKGSRQGVFWPSGLSFDGLLFLPEGPSDTAALLDLGLEAIGRPHCSGGRRIVAEIIRRVKPPQVIVVGDSDEAGRRGGKSLANDLLPYAKHVCVICPPWGVNDIRDWIRGGATRADVLQRVTEASRRRISMEISDEHASN